MKVGRPTGGQDRFAGSTETFIPGKYTGPGREDLCWKRTVFDNKGKDDGSKFDGNTECS
jgi:hypothetical protein